MAVMFSWPCLLSLLTMCITQLRIVMYIGQVKALMIKYFKLILARRFLASKLQANTSTISCYQRSVRIRIEPSDEPKLSFVGTVADNDTDEEDTVHFYLTVFGWLQIFCLLVAPVIGQVLDKDLSLAIDDPQHGDKSNDDDVIYRRVQSLRNTRNAYTITQVNFLLTTILVSNRYI